MRDHRAQVCVATDVAARGIDLPDLELVVHADLPKNTEALLHRSGRTGRAGRKGASVLIVPYSARRRTERLLREANIQATWGEPPSADDIKRRDDERLLGDALLQAPPEAADEAIVRALLAKHDAAHIAAAFVRLYRKGQAAPEDLPPAPDWSDGLEQRPERGARAERPERQVRAGPQDNFEGGTWVSLSVGRNKAAEPRWLIPLMCKAGGITKRQIGSIRIQQNETHVEIDAASVDAFMARLDGGRLEKSIFVTRMDGQAPPMERARHTPVRGDEREPRAHKPGPARGDEREQRAHKPGPARGDEREQRAHKPGPRAPYAKAKHAGSKHAGPKHAGKGERKDAARGAPPADGKKKWHPAG
jgi:ATP-dependent RNA helicase DeaD